MRPASKSDFFHGDKPYFGSHEDPHKDFDVYGNISNTGLAKTQVPKTINPSHPRDEAKPSWRRRDIGTRPPHTWNALTKTLCQQLEDRFPEWFSFVRSHRIGRYSSLLNETGTIASERANEDEEFLNPSIWWWWLKTSGGGVYSGSEDFRDSRSLGTYDPEQWNYLNETYTLITNINDDMHGHNKTIYNKQHTLMIQSLERILPDPNKDNTTTGSCV
eukprot:gnl/TRDRNA2_/TRDRNA2_161422_c1_seq2.p1 gnl/TRDRNA2_/TRDRNA2_161422_c1~~gnl/TRDRNA2_/TRDRNA2_161422_c1_seq2.p1  ORF type:complete len:217 (-),score=16.81 gnl/TRDRNA2_/TRDRNA2_161422_c1_seq2:110-760(-)